MPALTRTPQVPAVDQVGPIVEVPIEELGYWPSHLVVQGVELLHTTAGMPYWGAIVATAIGIRALMFPVAVMSAKNVGKMQKARPEIEKLNNKWQPILQNQPENHKLMVQYQEEMKALQKAYGLKPWQSLGMVMVQIPIFVSFFLGMQSVASYLDVTEGGFGWIPDLSVPDESYALPIATAATFWAQAELSAATQPKMGGISPDTLKMIFRGIAGIMIPITASYPSTVALYWCSGGVATVFQGMLFRTPAVRSALGMPELPKADDTNTANPELKNTLDKMKQVTLKAVEEQRARKKTRSESNS